MNLNRQQSWWYDIKFYFVLSFGLFETYYLSFRLTLLKTKKHSFEEKKTIVFVKLFSVKLVKNYTDAKFIYVVLEMLIFVNLLSDNSIIASFHALNPYIFFKKRFFLLKTIVFTLIKQKTISKQSFQKYCFVFKPIDSVSYFC